MHGTHFQIYLLQAADGLLWWTVAFLQAKMDFLVHKACTAAQLLTPHLGLPAPQTHAARLTLRPGNAGENLSVARNTHSNPNVIISNISIDMLMLLKKGGRICELEFAFSQKHKHVQVFPSL